MDDALYSFFLAATSLDVSLWDAMRDGGVTRWRPTLPHTLVDIRYKCSGPPHLNRAKDPSEMATEASK